MLEFQNIKTFLLKDILQIGQKKFLLLVKLKRLQLLKITVPWTYVINDLDGEEITGSFYETGLQKTKQKEFRIEKVIRKKGDKLHIKRKGHNNRFNRRIDKKDLV